MNVYSRVRWRIFRRRVYEVIEKADSSDRLSAAYDIVMIVAIVASLVPLAFKEETTFFRVLDKVTVVVFIVDYLLRWMTADYKLGKPGVFSYVRYPFTVMAIVDLVSILPSISVISNGFKVLRVLRMIRALRVVRVFKAMRYSRSFEIIANVLRTSKNSLIAVCALAGAYILISALVIFNVEPDSFNDFFEAIYWATVSLTTMGYGDIYPVSTMGRLVTMVSALFGIAIVALPAGIITAGYMTEIRKDIEAEQERIHTAVARARIKPPGSAAPEKDDDKVRKHSINYDL